jgi:hypothetical protein
MPQAWLDLDPAEDTDPRGDATAFFDTLCASIVAVLLEGSL